MDRTAAVPVRAEPARLRLTRAWETTTVSETVFGRLLGLFVLLVVVASTAGLAGGAAEQTFLLIFSSIVIEALPFILVGALASAALSLMAVAYVLSLCSEADAFIAASFTSFSPGAQLAFLVLGPIIDMKLTVLYGATFRGWFVPRLLLATVPLIVGGSLIFGAVIR